MSSTRDLDATLTLHTAELLRLRRELHDADLIVERVNRTMRLVHTEQRAAALAYTTQLRILQRLLHKPLTPTLPTPPVWDEVLCPKCGNHFIPSNIHAHPHGA